MNAEESDYMSNMAGVLLEAVTVYSSPAPGFNPWFLVGSVMLIFFFYFPVMCCAVLLFYFAFLFFYFLPNAVSFSGCSFLIATSVFSNVY